MIKSINISMLTAMIFLFGSTSVSSFAQIKTENNKPTSIILLIGDGMGLAQIDAALVVNKSLNLQRFKYSGFSRTYSASNYVTDSGASGTAMSTGQKTYYGAIGVTMDSLPCKTILEYAEDNGLSTGLVSTSAITHATPASFIAHDTSRYSYEAIAKDFLQTDIDVFIGGGRNHFTHRTDSLNLVKELRNKGYQVVFSIDSIRDIQNGKLAGLTAPEHNPPVTEGYKVLFPKDSIQYVDQEKLIKPTAIVDTLPLIAGRGEMLSIATKTAINILSNNKRGFFLMVEGSQIDFAGHANNLEYMMQEVIDFDKAVGLALDYAIEDKNTLVIVTADHETGGLALLNGNIKEGIIVGKFSTYNHTGIMVPVFAYGPGAEEFTGIQENTDLFDKMMTLGGFETDR